MCWHFNGLQFAVLFPLQYFPFAINTELHSSGCRWEFSVFSYKSTNHVLLSAFIFLLHVLWTYAITLLLETIIIWFSSECMYISGRVELKRSNWLTQSNFQESFSWLHHHHETHLKPKHTFSFFSPLLISLHSKSIRHGAKWEWRIFKSESKRHSFYNNKVD